MIFKRLFDVGASAMGLLVLWPVLAVVAILIRIKMPGGPVLFCQQRVGRGGRLFTCHKFRSMLVAPARKENDNKDSWSSVSVAGESRITPLGAKLRRYKLDELPELWDVLIGNMSFVGPRPDVPGYADRLEGEDRIILTLRPGITGPATLKYRNEEELLATVANPIEYNDTVIYPDKVRLNRYYAEHYSFWKDIEMIFATVLGLKVQFAGEEI